MERVELNYPDLVDIVREFIEEFNLEDVIDDIEKAIESAGIDVRYSDMSGLKTENPVSGYAFLNDGRPTIVVNGFENEKRQRFTMAHELGHIIFHWGWNPGDELDADIVEVSYRNHLYNEEEQIREEQANKFAIEFLAPTKAVKDFLDNLEAQGILDKKMQVAKLASYFKLSRQAANIRWNEVMA